MLVKVSEQIAGCLRRAAEADARAEVADDAKNKIEYQRMADSWRTLARSYEFQGSLGRFISFNSERADAVVDAIPAMRNDAETVLANTPFLLTRCSSDLRYLFVSEAYAKMVGHSPEEVVGKKIIEVMGETGFNTILPHIKSVLSGHRVEYEREVHFEDVGPRLLHVIYTPDKDPLGRVQGWIASILDITERKQIEAALHEKELQSRLLASIVESSDDAIVSKDLNGIITSWNRSAERIFGYSAEEAIGQPITLVIPRDRHSEEREILARIRRGERIEHFETVRQQKHAA